jgi:hypothetical protein
MTLTRRSSSFPDRDAKDSCDSRTQVDGEALKRSKGINPADIRVCGYLDSPHKWSTPLHSAQAADSLIKTRLRLGKFFYSEYLEIIGGVRSADSGLLHVIATTPGGVEW